MQRQYIDFWGLFALKCALGEKHMNNLNKNRCFDKFAITEALYAFLSINFDSYDVMTIFLLIF